MLKRFIYFFAPTEKSDQNWEPPKQVQKKKARKET